MPRKYRFLAGALALILLLVITLRLLATTDIGHSHLERGADSKTLLVIAHGLLGRTPTQPLIDLARKQYPDADLMTFDYQVDELSNSDPYLLTSMIEQAIDNADGERHYQHIILVGHSAGAVFLRKALVWAAGYAEDRRAGMAGLPESWPGRVERMVSIAGLNRGWTLDPKPEFMYDGTWLAASLLEKVARLTGVGRLLLSFQRGSPYIANLRVQWIEFARAGQAGRAAITPPLTLHLLGDQDNLVGKDDSKDISAASQTCFLTLRNTGHANIVGDISADPARVAAHERYSKIQLALSAPKSDIACDPVKVLEDPTVTRVIFVMHGIRDYGDWTNPLTRRVMSLPDSKNGRIAMVPASYGYFPMMPFLLYSDRQRNVRWFMDEFTEQMARFPNAKDFDFIGHSNGTYILASALQRYATLSVRNVYFAGSVVPQSYDWMGLIGARRVKRVVNVVATKDWVVAWFPRMFEQVAEWWHVSPRTGFLDLGAAGFRGFRDGADPSGLVENIEFLPGDHGTGVDMSKLAKLNALAAYAVAGETKALDALTTEPDVNGPISFISNICWIVWLTLIAIIALGGYVVARLGQYWLLAYAVLILALLNSG